MSETLDRAVDAALQLAAERPWGEVALRDVAAHAGVAFADLYALAPTRSALLDRLSRRLDRAALEAAAEDADAHDRLFEVVMARLEAMEPHRAALIAMARAEAPARLAARFPKSARAFLEAAGIDSGGWRGALRVAAMTAVWTRVLQVWRDDEGALNRTMAEIDRQLRRMRGALERVGAGY